LKTNSAYCSHPLLLPLALVKVVLDANGDRLIEAENMLIEIAKLTGQHQWTNTHSGNPLEIDFIATTRDFNVIGRGTAAATLNLTSMINTLRIIREFATTIDELNAGDSTGLEKDPDNTAATFIEGKMRYFAEACSSFLAQAEYIQKVNSTMIQVVS
jgi:hypothetical protein